MATPIIVFEDGQELVLPVSERVSIGRGEDNHVVADDERISNNHAEILLSPNGSVEVFDRNSTAGTWVNNQRVDRQILRPGDSIAFGPLIVVFELRQAPKAGPSTLTAKIPAVSAANRPDNNRRAEEEQAQARINALTKRQAEEESRLEALQKRLLDTESQVKARKDEAAAAEEWIAELAAETKKIETATREGEAALRVLATEREKKAEEVRQLADQEAEASARLQKVQGSISEENARLEAARNELAQVEERLRAGENQAGAIKVTLDGLTSAVASAETAKGELDAAIAALVSRRTDEEARLQRVQQALVQEDELMEPARRELAALQTQIEQATALLLKRQEEVQTAEAGLSALTAASDEAVMSQRERELSLQQLADRRSSEEAALSQVQAETLQETARLEDVRRELAQVESRVREALALLEGHDAKVHDAESALVPLKQRHDALQGAIAESEAQLSETNSLLAEEKTRLAKTSQRRGELEAELSSLRQEIAAAEAGGASLMMGLRRFFFVFPFVILTLAWWSASESHRGRTQGEGGVTAMLAEPMPAFHPYAPRTEAERQINDLVHEPLMRVGADGALQPALAELWRWSQDVTCWFADTATAKQAQERLQAQIGEKNLWAEWRLSTVRLIDNSLVLNFSDPTRAGTPQALGVIADLRPQNIAFWRIETRGPLKDAAQRFLAESPLAAQIRRVWFDHENAFEVVTVGPSQKLLDELRSFVATSTKSEVRMGLLGEVGALSEPVLDLDMRQGQTWHDGTPVTAYDVKTTIEQVNRRPWLLPNREALRHIQLMDIQEEGNRLHVVFRSRYGPALCGWAGLPVLPASWWSAHEGEDDTAFAVHPPPGAGPFRAEQVDERTLSLTPVTEGASRPRFLFHFDASPLMTEVGLSTNTTQLIWPAASPDNRHEMSACLTPPHRRHVVLWNTRHGPLADVKVRRAIAMITDEASIIASLPGTHTLTDASLFPPGMWLHTNASRVPHDPVEATKLLSESGWLPGVDGLARKSGRKLEFALLLVAGDPGTTRTAGMLAEQWRKLGAAVSVETLGTPDLLAQRLAERRFDAVLLEQRFEVSWDQFPWWHSSQSRPGGTNYAGIEDAQIDLLLEALATEFEPAAAADRVRQLEARLLPLHPMLPLFNTVDDAAVRSSLVGNQARTGWTLRQIAMKTDKPVSEPAAFKLKLPDE